MNFCFFFFSGNFPGCSVVKESAYQCRRHELDHWDGKIPWKRAWQPIPVFLLGKYYGQRSLAGYSPWGFKNLTWATKQQHVIITIHL